MQSLTFTGPLLSEPTKAWLLEGQGLTLKEGFAATITEYLICSFVTATMSIAGLVYFVVHFAPLSVVAGIATGIVCLFSGSVKVIDIAFLFIPLQLGVLEGAYGSCSRPRACGPPPASRWPSCDAPGRSRSPVSD